MMAGPLELLELPLQWWDHRRWKRGYRGGKGGPKGGLVGL
jgi:hypothetical protein